MQSRFTWYTLMLGLAALGAGCRNGVSADHSLRAAAGLYMLATVNGQPLPTSDQMAPIAGSVYLWPTGHVERHVTYRSSNGGTEEVASVGSFHFEDGAIVLELRPKGEYSPSSWRVHGSLADETLTMGYPGPADGWMEEEYRRR